jgi:putative spermidine/putrescine transport system substrate-binding protein
LVFATQQGKNSQGKLEMLRKSLAAAAIATGLLIAPGGPLAQQSNLTLRVANYGGVFTAAQKKYAGDLFTARTGVKIEYIDANPPDHLAKLIASKGREVPFDVAYLDDIIQEQAIRAGVLERLDPSILTNLKDIYDIAKNKEGYGPAMIFYSVGIAYNTQKYAEAGIPAPVSWADLWDPRLAGKVIAPDLSVAMGRDFLIAAARLEGGDENSLEKGIEKIATLKAQSYPSSSATIEALMKAGDVWAAPWINGRAWGLTDQGLPIRFILPKEGGFAGATTIDLVRNTKSPKEAQQYINLVMDPLPQLGQANEIPYGPTNRLLAPILAANPSLAQKFPSSPEDFRKLYVVNWEVYNKNFSRVNSLWNRRILSR